MKRLLILIALIAYVFGGECSECLDQCEIYVNILEWGKRAKCISNCYDGPCYDIVH